MKQVMIRRGQAHVVDVPAPGVNPGTLLVRVAWSCISTGTELATVRSSAEPLHRRALSQPDAVSRVIRSVREQGVRHTFARVTGKLQMGAPVGYSAAGTVVEVGAGLADVRPGDRVACAGAGIANHAEIIEVPRNLAVAVPDGVDLADASTVALGAIALQGVRRASPSLGEVVVVIGLGVIGQITVQALLANGCRVVASDPDAHRRALAQAAGVHRVVNPNAEDLVAIVAALTDQHGADVAIITASSESSEVISQACRATRRKGRVVIVGAVGLDLQRGDIYAKELDVLISTSYGAGRYDARYEEQGVDYPLAYVRWTSNRNMAEYLRLLHEKRVVLDDLGAQRFEVDAAAEAYEALQKTGERAPLLALLAYPERPQATARTCSLRPPTAGGRGARRMRVALIGAGGFAQGTHLPILARLSNDFEIHAIVGRKGPQATAVARQYRASVASTDVDAVLGDADVDLVVITTRHDTHGCLALRALEAGKAVFVEKPLALTLDDLDAFDHFYETHPEGPMLLTGFNRRFSPAAREIARLLEPRTSPLMVTYRMNAGMVAPDSWLLGPEGGGRNLGEACHIYDLFGFLCQSQAVSVSASSIRPGSGWRLDENFTTTISFDDGSVCALTYTALGHKSVSKEQMEVFAGGRVMRLDDYRALEVCADKPSRIDWPEPRKGHLEQWQALARALRGETPWPSPLWQQLQASRIALAVQGCLNSAEG